MVKSKKNQTMGISEQIGVSEKCKYYMEEDESNTEGYDSDDSEEDPSKSFDVLEETRSSFSRLSVNKKSMSRVLNEGIEGDPAVVEMVLPKFEEKDHKSFEVVQKIIQVGQVEKLKVDQCKLYLRKHGLRLTGNKDTLIGRIKEHLGILNGGGEKKYPASSFGINCKGDACTGDVVLFEQNVYEMFNLVSRSATGPPCGTRIIAGRIVKESYGAAKQQHTFTIEVLWSKGEKPLPPLHPLLIKGRNLYRLNTMRQRWEDECERCKILSEKHLRGSLARSNREARVEEKEMRKMLKINRIPRMENQKKKQEENANQNLQQKESQNSKTCKENTTLVIPLETVIRQSHLFPNAKFSNTNGYPSMSSSRSHHDMLIGCNSSKSPFQKPLTSVNYPSNIPFRSISHEQSMNYYNPSQCTFQSRGHEPIPDPNLSRNPFRGNWFEQRQLCRLYAQGRCYYGYQCKYLHEYRESHRGQMM